jgi:site-specific recombinase XerD
LRNGSLRPAKSAPIIYFLAVALRAVIRWVSQLNRLLKLWVVEAGLDPRDYSVESLRRTKALHILKGTGDLQTVRALLGHEISRSQNKG